MMKKFFSIMLAFVMFASVAIGSSGAQIIYFDDFENGKNEEFWGGIGKFQMTESDADPDNMVMSGFEDAVIGQSNLRDEDPVNNPGVFADIFGCFRNFTLWTDITLSGEAIQSEYGAGFWVTDTRDMELGLAPHKTVYNMFYMVKETEDGNGYVAFSRLWSDSPRRDKDYPDHIYGELVLPEVGAENYEGEFVPGFNLGGEVVRIGVRFANGNITGYANGRIVASYNYSTIGHNFSPILVENHGCYVEFDNFTVGTYDENVKRHTRNDSYTLAEAEVSVSNGATATTEKHAEDSTVTVTAPAAAEAGKSFDKWTMKIGGREVTDVETAKLLHGIEIGDLSAKELTFTMPNENVELVATYKDAVAHTITVTDGTADQDKAVVGTTVKVSANAAPAGKSFDKWEVVKGAVSFADATKAETTFVMDDADVEIKAVYKDGVSYVPGDVNGDGNINARDVIMTMRYILSPNKPPAGFNFEAADMDNNGSINAKDIIAMMREILKKK